VIFTEKHVAALLLNADIVAGNQQDGDWLVIAANHVFVCCVKRSPSKSVTIGIRMGGQNGRFPPVNVV